MTNDDSATPGISQVPDVQLRSSIEGYEVGQQIGRGAMGSVWHATERATGRRVAIKFLDSNRLHSNVARARFEREVRLAARLDHPYIASIFDTGLTDTCYFYVMELVEGLPLDDHVRRNLYTLEETIDLLHRVCMAVDYAHSQGIVHRDLKPSNILITPEGEPRIVDFGLAKALTASEAEECDPNISMEGHVAGSPGYMSPEQAAGRIDRIDHRCDIYALGAILFKLFTGQHPHEQQGPLTLVVRRISDEPPRRPRQLNPRIDRELDALLMTALAPDLKDRYPSAAILAQDLQRYLDGESLSAHVRRATGMRQAIQRHWKKAALIALLILHTTISILIGQMLYNDLRLDTRAEPKAPEKVQLPFKSGKASGTPADALEVKLYGERRV